MINRCALFTEKFLIDYIILIVTSQKKKKSWNSNLPVQLESGFFRSLHMYMLLLKYVKIDTKSKDDFQQGMTINFTQRYSNKR